MRALLFKERLNMGKPGKYIAMFLIIAFCSCVLRSARNVFYMMFLVNMPKLTADDARCGWSRYSAALPLKRSDTVKTKFAVAALNELLYITAGIAGIRAAVLLGMIEDKTELVMCMFGFISLFTASSLMQYLSFRFDMSSSRTSRIVLLVSMFVWLVLVVISACFAEAEFVILLMLGAAAAALASRLLSLVCAVRAYVRRDL